MMDRIFSGGLPALMILGARLLQNANGFLLTAIVARHYGLDAVGTLTLAAIPTTLVALFGTFGLHFRFAQMDQSDAVRNSLGLVSVLISLPVVFVLSLAFGHVFAHTPGEQIQLAVLAASSPFFAQANLTSALQILQKKEAQSIISPGLNAAGLILGAFAPDFTLFCICVFLFRLLAIGLPYALLPHDFAAARRAAGELRGGLRYLFSDAAPVLADNAIMLLSTGLFARSDLGLLGICRQLLTASDTPGWANIQSVYPRLVSGGASYFEAVLKSMVSLGAVLAVSVALAALPAGLYVFRAPDLWFYAAILMASVPARYVVVSVETYLKARGEIRFANRVTGCRAVAGLAIVYGATRAGGLEGHVYALSGFFIALALVEIALVWRVNSMPGVAALREEAA